MRNQCVKPTTIIASRFNHIRSQQHTVLFSSAEDRASLWPPQHLFLWFPSTNNHQIKPFVKPNKNRRGAMSPQPLTSHFSPRTLCVYTCVSAYLCVWSYYTPLPCAAHMYLRERSQCLDMRHTNGTAAIHYFEFFPNAVSQLLCKSSRWAFERKIKCTQGEGESCLGYTY